MDLTHCGFRVVRSPYGATGLRALSEESDRYAPFASQDGTASSSKALVGARGLLRLREDTRRGNGSPSASTDDVSAEQSTDTETVARPVLLSLHEKGILLAHDAATGAVTQVVTHDGASGAVVSQLVATKAYVFTSLQDAPNRQDDSALEADFNVYAWPVALFQNTKAGAVARRSDGLILRHHKGRVCAIAATPEHPTKVVSAGADGIVCLWDCQASTAAPVWRTDVSELGGVTALWWGKDTLVMAANNAMASVWKLTARAAVNGRAPTPPVFTRLGESPPDEETTPTALFVQAAANTGKRPGSGSFPMVYTGAANGQVQCWRALPGKPNITVASGDSVTPYTRDVYLKCHRALVSILAVHLDTVIVSGSLTDGLSFFHLPTGRRIEPQAPGGGVTALVLDRANCTAVVGYSNGTLSCYDYSVFAAATAGSPVTRAASESPQQHYAPVLLWEIHIHKGAVTGIVLEVASGNMWKRLTTTSSDGNFVTLSFTGPESQTGLTGDAHIPGTVFSLKSGKGEIASMESKVLSKLHACIFPGESERTTRSIVTACCVDHAVVRYAISRSNSSDVDLIGPGAVEGSLEVCYRVSYAGSILPAAEFPASSDAGDKKKSLRKLIMFSSMVGEASNARPPPCVHLLCDPSQQHLIIVYDDGMVHIVDLATLSLASRSWISGPVASITARNDGLLVHYQGEPKPKLALRFHDCVPAFN